MAIVSLYQVEWRNSSGHHNYESDNVDYVIAAPGTDGVALGALIQASLTDGRSVSVKSARVIRTGIIQ